jgi:hypothetical protein
MKIIDNTSPTKEAATVNQVKPNHEGFLYTLPANIHIPIRKDKQDVIIAALCMMPSVLSDPGLSRKIPARIRQTP